MELANSDPQSHLLKWSIVQRSSLVSNISPVDTIPSLSITADPGPPGFTSYVPDNGLIEDDDPPLEDVLTRSC